MGQTRDQQGRFESMPVDPTAPRRVASFKCSADLLDRIDTAARATGTTRQGWILSAVTAALSPQLALPTVPTHTTPPPVGILTE
jgi:hypothetical protein